MRIGLSGFTSLNGLFVTIGEYGHGPKYTNNEYAHVSFFTLSEHGSPWAVFERSRLGALTKTPELLSTREPTLAYTGKPFREAGGISM